MLYLTRERFDVEIREIAAKSLAIDGGSWRLAVASEPQQQQQQHDHPVIYLEKSEQRFVSSSNSLLAFTFHIVYSEAFGVPVLYLNVSSASGRTLVNKQLYDALGLLSSATPSDSADSLILTQQEHPILFRPFYFVHPCKTAEWMSITAAADANTHTNADINYTLKWLSFLDSSLRLNLINVHYALDQTSQKQSIVK